MNLFSRLVRLPLRLVPSGLTVRVLTGELKGGKWITGASTHGCWVGTYERDAQRMFRTFVREGMVVYDVGANVGFFTLLAARLAGRSGRVYSFEPVPRNLQYLRKHVEANAASTVTVMDIALSSRKGTARFASAHNPSIGRLDASGDVEVRTETIDDLVSSGQIPPPAFVKMDVEGAEHDVLTGAVSVLQKHKPVILLSTHGTTVHDRCCAFLRELGYELRITRDGDGHYTVLATN